ncbi:protein of unknown function (plasmid) [Rhodovastum atsumiense]|nr:protein of unknown function [Rhodovastum atsumiense]
MTIVPSIRAYSKSGSPDSASKIRSNTPALAQRRKRWNTLFQLPNSDGRSRHGIPVRTRHRTASRNSRVSRPVTPGSAALPSVTGSILSHTASLMTKRSRSTAYLAPAKRSLNHAENRKGIPECQQTLGRLRLGQGRGAPFIGQPLDARPTLQRVASPMFTYRHPPR